MYTFFVCFFFFLFGNILFLLNAAFIYGLDRNFQSNEFNYPKYSFFHLHYFNFIKIIFYCFKNNTKYWKTIKSGIASIAN